MLMPPRVTAAEFQEKHNRRLKGAVEDIRRGVERVSESPTAKAARKQDKMIAELTRAVQSGKWARSLNAVSLEEWKRKTVEKGVPRIASGIDEAAARVTAFAEKLLTFESTLMDTVAKMPDLTIEDSVNRATAWIRGMAKFQGR